MTTPEQLRAEFMDSFDVMCAEPEPRLMLALGIHPKTGEFVYRLPPEWRTWLR